MRYGLMAAVYVLNGKIKVARPGNVIESRPEILSNEEFNESSQTYTVSLKHFIVAADINGYFSPDLEQISLELMLLHVVPDEENGDLLDAAKGYLENIAGKMNLQVLETYEKGDRYIL